jgi:hypothetical protein
MPGANIQTRQSLIGSLLHSIKARGKKQTFELLKNRSPFNSGGLVKKHKAVSFDAHGFSFIVSARARGGSGKIFPPVKNAIVSARARGGLPIHCVCGYFSIALFKSSRKCASAIQINAESAIAVSFNFN